MALGFYLLTWVGGLFFAIIFILFGVLQYTLNGLRGEPNEYICITLTPLFFIPLLMVLPFFGPSYPYYNIQQVGSLSVGVITFSIPLMYRYLINKFGYRYGLVRERIAKAESTKPERIRTGEYTCPICGKKSRGVGIVEHIKTKHRAGIEKKSELVKIRQFFDENPELSVGLKKLGIGSIHGGSPLEKMSKYDFLLPVFTIAVLFVISILFFPSIIGGFFGTLTPSGTALTIAEVHPMEIGRAWEWFTISFYIALFAMVILALDLVLRNRPEEVLILVWSIIMFITVGGLGVFRIEGIGQNRFAYYYTVNAAILSGLFFMKAFEFLTGGEEREERRESTVGTRFEKRKGGKGREKRSEGVISSDIRLIIFVFAIMIMFVIGILKVGIESIIPLAAIVAILFLWTHASNMKKSIEGPLRKTLAVILIVFIVFYPFPLNAVAKPFPSPSNLPLSAAYSINTARGGIGAEENWYEALRWMRNNTPEPGVDYYGVYEEPYLNEKTGVREDYKYPPSAYGVMSWWDYGHIITWIAHRIPNANPFQAGALEAAKYLIETNESRANEMLKELRTRYVITDFPMVDFMSAPAWPSNPKYVMPTWAEKNPNPWFTMEVRLHFFDGLETAIPGGIAPHLKHYRLVHESPTYYLPFIVIDSETNRELYWWTYIGNYNDAMGQAQLLHGHFFSMPAGVGIEEDLDEGIMPEMLKSAFNSTGIPLSEDSTVVKVNEGRWIIRDEKNKDVFIIEKKEGTLNVYLYGVPTGQPNIKAWTPEYLQPVSFVKVFEYVKGARIEGTAPNGSLIEVSTTITTNQGRTFTYSARTTANDSYEFIVPYSTEGPVEGGTNFDVSVSPYTIRAGHFENETVVWDVEKEVRIHEEDVMGGRTIKVDLL
ncbi:MAG: hypothetical protein QMD22_04985 [archaeon]|nr:hypothetical protein [archaeon]